MCMETGLILNTKHYYAVKYLPEDAPCSDQRHRDHLVSQGVSVCEGTLLSGTSCTPREGERGGIGHR